MSSSVLDNVDKIKQEDKKGVLKATEMLADQCQQAWDETSAINIPDDYKDVDNIVVGAMGGSHLGAQLINSVYRTSLKQPLIVQNQYGPPGYVDENSLVLATSFSGNTEEVLSFAKAAQAKKAKIICITSNGKLAEFAKANNLPVYIFESKYNPSKIPRYGSGYLFISQMVFLSKIGTIELGENDIKEIISTLRAQKDKYTLTVPEDENPAKQLATKLQNKVPILVASEHLTGSAYIFKNQINESAKNFAALFEIPELNHHLLEGLAHPESNKQTLNFLFFESNLYHERNQKRHAITQDVIRQQKITTTSFKPTSESQLTQAFETLAFTSYTALYLSILNSVDPGPNPWVDYLKNKLRD